MGLTSSESTFPKKFELHTTVYLRMHLIKCASCDTCNSNYDLSKFKKICKVREIIFNVVKLKEVEEKLTLL